MRKKIYYVDMAAIESGKDLYPFEMLVRQNLLTTQDWDRHFVWMDIELALGSLSDYERHCLVSSLIEGYTQEEIAARLHVSQEAVVKQIKRAKRKMRNFLEEGYKTPPKCTHIWEAPKNEAEKNRPFEFTDSHCENIAGICGLEL